MIGSNSYNRKEMNCGSVIELHVSIILKFEYYGTICNVKKILNSVLLMMKYSSFLSKISYPNIILKPVTFSKTVLKYLEKKGYAEKG